MIMMGPKKDRGGMLAIIMEKMKKNHYEDGKESNEEFMEKGGHKSYENYKEEVDSIFNAIHHDDKEKFANALKGFIKKCVSSMDKDDDKDKDKY